MYKLEFSKSFIIDQTVALEYISLMLFNPIAAKRLRKKIDEKIDAISIFPEGFPEFDTEGKTEYTYRKVKVGNYYIIYRFDKETIYFSRFVYAKRNLENIGLDLL